MQSRFIQEIEQTTSVALTCSDIFLRLFHHELLTFLLGELDEYSYVIIQSRRPLLLSFLTTTFNSNFHNPSFFFTNTP
jgi:hypothetical protein